jgi:hypothetical protein
LKKLSLVLLLWLSAFCLIFGQVSSAKKSLFNEANNTIGKRVPSKWKENDGLFWKSLDIAVGKEYSAVQVKGNLVEMAIVGCVVANKSAQTKWLKESYDTLIADKWALVSGNADDFVLTKSDRYVTSSINNDGGAINVSVVFMTKSTAESAASGGNTGGKTWTTVDVRSIFYNKNNTGDDYIYAIAYGNNRYVAFGDIDKMGTSTDGVKWTALDANKIFGKSIPIAMTFGGGKFVAGSSDGRIATSTDGLTWTIVDVSKIFGTGGYGVSAIAYGNNKFVAGGTNGKIATSTDGTKWTAVDASKIFGDTGQCIRSIAYGNGRFVAVDYIFRMGTSTNGTTWTATDISKISSVYGSGGKYGLGGNIVYGNGKFVVAGIGISTSTNGTNWTAAVDISKIAGSDSHISGIAYGNNKFVAICANGKALTSTDGITWTVVDSSDKFDSYGAITYGGGKFVASGSDFKMLYLPD